MRARNGFTLVELLVTAMIGLVVLAAGVALMGSLRKVRLEQASIQMLEEQADETVLQLQEDLAGAGAGTGNGKARALVQADGRRVPAAYLSPERGNLFLLKTTPDELGKVLHVNSARITISGKYRYWNTLKVGQPVLFAPTGGDPALMALAAVPTQAVPADLPGGLPNGSQCVVLQVQPMSSCYGLSSLSTAIQPGAIATPLGSVARYYMGDGGLRREELLNCSLQPDIADSVIISPLIQEVEFTYRTATGERTSLPTDLTTLTGLGVRIVLRDPTTKLEKKIILETAVPEWRSR